MQHLSFFKFHRAAAVALAIFSAFIAAAESDLAIDIKEGLKALDQTSQAQQKVADSLAESVVEDATGEEALDEAEVLSNAAKQSGELSKSSPQGMAASKSRASVEQSRENGRPLSFSEFRIKNARDLKRAAESTFEKIEPYAPITYEFLNSEVAGVSIFCLIAAAAALAAALIAQKYLVEFLIRLASLPFSAARSDALKAFLERIKRPIRAFIILIGAHTAFELAVSDPTAIVAVGTLSAIILLGILFWIFGIVTLNMMDVASRKFSSRYPAAKDLLALSKGGVKWFLTAMFVLVSLDVVGVNVGALIATFAIGAAALAFASKDTIANFVGSIAIIIDRPFVVGDTIKVNGVEGVVQSIGMRSTIIKTPQQTILSAPNSTLASDFVNNVSRDPAEAVSMTLRISMDADADQIEAIVGDIKDIVQNDKSVDRNSVEVLFEGFGEWSLDVSVNFCVPQGGMTAKNTRQRISLAIMRALKARNLRLAVPMREIIRPPMDKSRSEKQ